MIGAMFLITEGLLAYFAFSKLGNKCISKDKTGP